jgi:ribose transport system substrate-binding protein
LRKSALWLLALGVMAVGCGKEETPPTATPNTKTTLTNPAAGTVSAGTALSTSTLDAVQRATKPYKIVLIVKTKNNPFFIPMIQAFEDAGRKLGFATEVQAGAQEASYEEQVALVQTEVSKGANAILITPADSKALVPALKKAADAGVLIINLDNRLDPETVKAQGLELGGYVGADNMMGGEKAGLALLESLGGKGNVAVLEGIRGVDNAEARKKGFELAVTHKLKIVAYETGEWETEKAYNKTLAILAAHPDLNGIFCANDNMAIGAMKAVAEKGKSDEIKIVGYDDIPTVTEAINSGKLVATIEQHPELMGMYGARMALGILEGSVKKGGEILVDLETIKRRSVVSPRTP